MAAGRETTGRWLGDERHRDLVDISPVAILVNRNNRIEFANPAACELFGATSPEQLYGKSPFDLFHPDFHESIGQRIAKLLEGERVPLVEQKIVRVDGTSRAVEVVACRVDHAAGPAIQVLLRDVTERKQKEEQLRRLNRIHTALNNSNRALLHASNEASLLHQVCKIVTDDCGYAMVWIGFAEQDERKTIRPVAHAGFEDGYLESLRLTWADTERGRGPTGTAIRNGQPCMCRNMLTDPAFAPWREEALKRGYASSLVVPLMDSGAAFGAITIYSREPDAFSADEVRLLQDLAANLAYGINVLRLREAHERAEIALRESERRVRLKLESILSPPADVGDLELADILDSAALQSLMEKFYPIAGLPMAIIDVKGKVLVGVGWQEVCTKFHRVNPESCKHCVESDRELSAGVKPGEFKLYHCKNNMWDIATPIMVGDKHLGNLFSGQFFFQGEPINHEMFRRQARRFGFDEEQYLDALERVPRLSRRAIELGMAYLTKLADVVSKLSYSNIKLARLLSERDGLTSSLRSNETRLRLALDAARAGTWEWDLATGTSTWADELCDVFCLPPQNDGLTVDSWLATVHPENRAAIEPVMREAATKGTQFDVEYRIANTGDQRWVRICGRPVSDSKGKPVRFVGIAMDITAGKRAEAALITSEKLASVGRMAATIAHEINNPLAAVMNTLYLAKSSGTLTDSVAQYLDIADSELKRISHITRQALGFYRESVSPVPTSVCAVLESVLELLKSKIKGKRVTIQKQWDRDVQVIAVPGELRQVFSNLVVNSLDAVEPNGTIVLRVSSSDVRANGRSCVRVIVADNGHGIAAAVRSRIFEPFFTTKDAVGTGLGLWVSKQIVAKHGGVIRVHSSTDGPRKGTAFAVVLPATTIDGETEHASTRRAQGAAASL